MLRIGFALCLFGLLAIPASAEKNLARPPGTTRYAPMVRQLRLLLDYDQRAGRHCMQLASLGRSVKGRELWMVTLRDPSVPPESTRRLLYLCRQHGHEPASTEAALAFVTQIVKSAPAMPLADALKHVTVSIVPMANPDGSEAFLRHNAHNVDLNRDWLKRTQPETRALWHAVQTIRPDLMTDQHELYPDDIRPDFTETAGPGCGADATVIQTCEDTQQIVALSLHTERHWITDTHPARLAHRYGSIIARVPTLLFETNRLHGSGRTVASRALAHLRFMTVVLRDLAGERDQILSEAGIAPGTSLPSADPPLPAANEKSPGAPTPKTPVPPENKEGT